SAQQGYQPITTDSSLDARALVMAHAGAFPRDTVTNRIMNEVTNRNGSWGVHAPNNLMAGLTATSPLPDTDDDGMPDAWEQAHGLNPNNGSDHNTIMPSGYTAIEEYINEIADVLSGQAPPGGGGGGEGGGAGDEGGAGGAG